MKSMKRNVGPKFLALIAVYYGQVVLALAASGAASAAATGAGPTLPYGDAPASQPADPFASSTTQPLDLQPVPDVKSGGPPPKITLSDSGTFSIQINNDVPLVEVLRMIGSQAQVSIIPSRDVRGTVPAMDLYNVTVNEALDAILTSNGFAYEQKGNIIYVLSEAEMEKRKKKDLETDVYRLYYISAQDAQVLIKPHLSLEGIISLTPASETGTSSGGGSGGSGGSSSGGSSSGGSSGGSGGGGTGGNSYADTDLLIVTDHPEIQEKIRKIIKELDHRPRQVLVEATILEAELTENNQLGINFTAIGSVNFADLGILPSAGLPGILAGGAAGGSSSGGSGSGAGGTSSNVTLPVTGAQASKGFNTLQSGQGGLQVGVVQDDFAVFLNALESVSNTTVLSNPKVLTLDKQAGYVHIGETIYYTGGTTQTQTSTTASTTSLDTGITLTFRPFIGDDGYIRMEIDPGDSTPVGTGNPTLGLPPNINKNEVTSTIMVKDGHTVLIGGLFRDNSSTTKAQVPFFGSLPLAGPLFGQTADSTDRQEVIFLLTPHIVKDDDQFSDLSEATMKDLERERVGVRRGMMPWGRERLAETCYESAETELHKPNPDMNMVRWHLDCATNLNPTFLEAIKLKEKITGETLTTSDNSSIRSFVRRMMLSDNKPAAVLDSEDAPRFVRIAAPPVAPVTTGVKAATQPSSSADQSSQTAEAPATQPSIAESPAPAALVMDNPPTAPAPQSSIAQSPASPSSIVEIPATQPSMAESPTTQPSIATLPPDSPTLAEAAPATQPSTPSDAPAGKSPSPDAAADLRDPKDR